MQTNTPDLNPFKEYHKLILEDFEIPVEIHHEHRRSARVSLAHQKAIVRIPILCSVSEKENHINWAKSWIYKKLTQDPESKIKYIPRSYENNSVIRIWKTDFTIRIEYLPVNIASGKRIGTELFLQIPESCPPFQRSELAGKLISKIMAVTYLKPVQNKVKELNDLHFQKSINKISLRNNSSNWGSCSTSGNISLSTRLLLCPEFIFDYLIIHELAHLVHHNHSDRYWNLVERVMPNYKIAETWLKTEGLLCRW